MKIFIGFILCLCFASNSAKFIDLYSDDFYTHYRVMNASCHPWKGCTEGAKSYREFAARCVYNGCRPATINDYRELRDAKRLPSKLPHHDGLYVGLSKNNTEGQWRWTNGRAANSALDKQINVNTAGSTCSTCKGYCISMTSEGLTKWLHCSSSYPALKGICECRNTNYGPLEYERARVAIFNANNDVMGGFRAFGEKGQKLNIKGTIGTENKSGKIQIILYLNLKEDGWNKKECERAASAKQDQFEHEEEVEEGDYFFSGSGSKRVSQVHADLGEFEFPAKTSPSGPILSIDVKDVPPLLEKVSHQYFIVIWQNNRSIGCSGFFSSRLYGFWENYNLALFRYATGINIGTWGPY